MHPTARDYLEGVRSAVRREETLGERLEAVKSRMEGVGAIEYKDMPGSPNANPDGVHNTVVRYLEIVKDLEAEQAFTTSLVEQAWGMLKAMRSSGFPGDVIDELEFYYLWGMETREIADMVDRSVSYIRHRRLEYVKMADPWVPKDAS